MVHVPSLPPHLLFSPFRVCVFFVFFFILIFIFFFLFLFLVFFSQDMKAGRDGPGLVTHWQQRPGILIAAGGSPLLRMWDLAREQLWSYWPVAPETCITVVTSPGQQSGGGAGVAGDGGYSGSALSAGLGGGGTIAAGMANGTIKLFDARDTSKPILTLTEHKNWIVNLHFDEVSGIVFVGFCLLL